MVTVASLTSAVVDRVAGQNSTVSPPTASSTFWTLQRRASATTASMRAAYTSVPTSAIFAFSATSVS